MTARLPPPRRRGLLALLCVAGLHLVFLSWLTRPVAPRKSSPAGVTVTLRLLPLAEPRIERPPVNLPERRAPRKPDPIAPRQPAAITQSNVPTARPAMPANADAITDPATTAAAATEAAPSPQPAASQPPRPLDLNLPRGYSLKPDARNPAIDDPRATTARLTPEQRMAGALDTREIQDRLSDGSLRIRRGAECLIVKPARTGQLFAMDPSAARAPGTVSQCP